MTRKLAYFEDRGSDLKRYQLLLAVYYDRLEQAQAILETDPDQLNLQDPYGGLTALHIAIFRQNPKMVRLLLGRREIDAQLADNFNRRAVDMLDYTVNQEIFEAVIEATYPDEMRGLEEEMFEEGVTDRTIVPLKPKGP